MCISWPTLTPRTHTSSAPSGLTSTHLDHLHGGLSKHNLLPTSLGWQEVINESEFMPFFAMVLTCPECREMEQLLGGMYPNCISDGFLSLHFFSSFHWAGRAQCFFTLLGTACIWCCFKQVLTIRLKYPSIQPESHCWFWDQTPWQGYGKWHADGWTAAACESASALAGREKQSSR